MAKPIEPTPVLKGDDATGTGSGGYGFCWRDGEKNGSGTGNRVRPVLAF